MKVCRACGAKKPLDEFHRDKAAPDGHRPRCKVCIKAYDDTLQEERNRRAREAYCAGPQAKIAKSRQYHLDHPEWSKERLRAHHVANKEIRKERAKARGNDPVIAAKRREATRISESKRRAIKAEAEVASFAAAELTQRLLEFDNACYICEAGLEVGFHWDHYQPLARGGAHTLENLRPACSLCNVRKSACWPFTAARQEEIRQEVLSIRRANTLSPSEEERRVLVLEVSK